MKKLSLFIFATTLVAAVSCNKSNSPINPDPTPTPSPDSEKTIEFILPVTTDNHLAFFEQKFEFDLNGTKVTFKESDMTEMTTESDLEQITSLIDATKRILNGTGHTTEQYYKYTVGKLKKGETMVAVSIKPVIKSDRPAVESIDFLIGFGLLVEGEEASKTYVTYHKGLDNTDEAITTLYNLTSKEFNNLTYSYSSQTMVDLGLSVKWASCNLGASKPEEYGRYFAWSEVVGQFWNGSKWSGKGFSEDPTYYEVDEYNNLTSEYDAAQVHLKEPWRMPTHLEQLELVKNCTSTWTDDYNGTGVAGRIFTSNKKGYTDKSIFLPAAGGGCGSALNDAGSDGYYWSSTMYDGYNAHYILINSDDVYTLSAAFLYGHPIRPVSD